jgi:hypothetical protein
MGLSGFELLSHNFEQLGLGQIILSVAKPQFPLL